MDIRETERLVGKAMRDLVMDCQSGLHQIEENIEQVLGSPLVSNGLQTALKEYLAEIRRVAGRHEGLFEKVRDHFGTKDPEGDS